MFKFLLLHLDQNVQLFLNKLKFYINIIEQIITQTYSSKPMEISILIKAKSSLAVTEEGIGYGLMLQEFLIFPLRKEI